MAKQPSTRFVTPAGVAGFAYLNKPDSEGKFANNKYKVTISFNKDDVDLTPMKRKCEEAAKLKWGKVPKNLGLPFRDGDKMKNANGEPKEEFAGKWVLTPQSKYPPTLIDAARVELPSNIWPASGDLIKVSVSTYAYVSKERVKNVDGDIEEVETPAISVQLRGVQLLEKRNGAAADAANDFDDESDEYDAVTASAAAAPTDGAAHDDDDDF